VRADPGRQLPYCGGPLHNALGYLVNQRNLAINARSSYRDMLVLLLAFVSKILEKPIDRLLVTDLSPDLVRKFFDLCN
jgi:hypothetical protein